MAASFLKTLFLVIVLCFICGAHSDHGESAYLKVPAEVFSGTVSSTVSVVQEVVSNVSKFSKKIHDFQLNNAISDCLDLLDLSMDHLSSAISAASLNYNGEYNGTGNPRADVKALLSGALINQDTCLEGFDGTNSSIKDLFSGSLGRATSLINNLLSMVKPNPTTISKPGSGDGGGRKLITTEEEFPRWLKPRDRKLLQAANGPAADVVVAADGSGNYTSIAEAIAAAPDKSSRRYVIYVKKGVYMEHVVIGKKKWNIMMIGDGMDATVITGNHSKEDGWTTFRSATFGVMGKGFIASDITFENTAGPEKHQAVAYRSDSDLSVLYRCAIRGYQDTLYAHSMRHFYRECKITGTIDFIFGHAAAVFQGCEIQARKGLPNQKNTITAQGRKSSTEETGFTIQFCNVSVEPGVVDPIPTYLGRPWRLYSRTVFMQSYISSFVRPEGWLEWNGNFALNTLYYGEYMNYGPGAILQARVKWPGFHVINDSTEAEEFTVAELILGNTWLPSTGVTYTAGL